MLCRHCQRRQATRPRGLCPTCYYGPARGLYQSTSKYSPRKAEPTQEELDCLIAEQMRCLPPWWDMEARRAERDDA